MTLLLSMSQERSEKNTPHLNCLVICSGGSVSRGAALAKLSRLQNVQERKWKTFESATPHEANHAGCCCIKESCAQAYFKPISLFSSLPSFILSWIKGLCVGTSVQWMQASRHDKLILQTSWSRNAGLQQIVDDLWCLMCVETQSCVTARWRWFRSMLEDLRLLERKRCSDASVFDLVTSHTSHTNHPVESWMIGWWEWQFVAFLALKIQSYCKPHQNQNGWRKGTECRCVRYDDSLEDHWSSHLSLLFPLWSWSDGWIFQCAWQQGGRQLVHLLRQPNRRSHGWHFGNCLGAILINQH